MAENKEVYTAAELAELVSGELRGKANLKIYNVAGVAESDARTVTFAENREYLDSALSSDARLIIVPEDLDIDTGEKTLLRVSNPRLAYARIASLFAPVPFLKPGIHPAAIIAENAVIGEGVSIHPGVVVDEKAIIGEKVILAPGVYVGKNTEIGDNTVIHPNAVIEYDSIIGSDVIIHGGTVIGSDGYGFVTHEKGHHKIPQLGNVIIEDRVEIGANVTIDRGTSGPTVVGRGSKIDNLVQIAHNVKLGAECLIIAQVGIAGSAELGRRVTMAGKAGAVGHIKIGENTTIASKSLVTKTLPAGVFYSGNPARDHHEELKIQAARRKMPDVIKRLKELEKELKILKGDSK
ncbi:MAG: UDP-3-O-(3-hydroxymyristoyl)glucosamine N-acyltransferase [Halanaerobiales bacterium]